MQINCASYFFSNFWSGTNFLYQVVLDIWRRGYRGFLKPQISCIWPLFVVWSNMLILCVLREWGTEGVIIRVKTDHVEFQVTLLLTVSLFSSWRPHTHPPRALGADAQILLSSDIHLLSRVFYKESVYHAHSLRIFLQTLQKHCLRDFRSRKVRHSS
jgi:hypothetical protein